MYVHVGKALLGRVVDVLRVPIDVIEQHAEGTKTNNNKNSIFNAAEKKHYHLIK